ncbi:MAG TPA: hypothetical protein VGD59_01110 [Acidisarcina sp.]
MEIPVWTATSCGEEIAKLIFHWGVLRFGICSVLPPEGIKGSVVAIFSNPAKGLLVDLWDVQCTLLCTEPPEHRKVTQVPVKKSSNARKAKKQAKSDEKPGLTLRLPTDLREAVTEESRVKGDLARIVLFALAHVDKEDVVIKQTRKAGLPLTNPQLLHVGAEARVALKQWAKEEGVSVNAIVVSVLETFFKQLKRSKALREELRLEIRARRGFLPT